MLVTAVPVKENHHGISVISGPKPPQYAGENTFLKRSGCEASLYLLDIFAQS